MAVNQPPDVSEGDRPSAAGHNAVKDAAFRELSGSAPGFSGPDGMAVRDHEQFPEPHAKCQSDWDENSGDPKVAVKMCDADGENVRGPEFDVDLPRRRDASVDYDPEAYSGDVIEWRWDYPGRRICITTYLTSKIGDLRWQVSTARIQTGWARCVIGNSSLGVIDMGALVPMGHETSGAESNDPLDEVGERNHGAGVDNNHDDHEIDTVKAFDATVTDATPVTNLDIGDTTGTATDFEYGEFLEGDIDGYSTVALPHSKTDNRQPSLVLVFIQRYK